MNNQLNPLLVIEKKRSILQEVMTIAQSIEHIQSCLWNIMALGKPVMKLSVDIRQNYKYLEQTYQSQPGNKLKEDSEKLDRFIQLNLGKILEIAGTQHNLPQAELDAHIFEQYIIRLQNLITAFKKSVLTSISLRVLLQKRGITVGALSLPIPESVLHEHITFFETKEKAYRAKAIHSIMDMDNEINLLLANDKLPKQMKEVLLKNKANLLENIKHIEAGKSLETLPTSIETLDLSINVEEIEVETIEISAPTAPISEENTSNLSNQVKEWLDSSWDTSWESIKNKKTIK